MKYTLYFLFLLIVLPFLFISSTGCKTSSISLDYITVEKKPEFPGGEQELLKFIGKNVRYPLRAKENGISGTVYVSFVVDKKGKPVNVIVVRGVAGGADLDAEAVRAVKSMPKWKPGKLKGKKVNVKYTLPIKFVLK